MAAKRRSDRYLAVTATQARHLREALRTARQAAQRAQNRRDAIGPFLVRLAGRGVGGFVQQTVVVVVHDD